MEDTCESEADGPASVGDSGDDYDSDDLVNLEQPIHLVNLEQPIHSGALLLSPRSDHFKFACAASKPRFCGSAPLPVRSPSSPCATLSMLTYYRTSRSLHFPFWARSMFKVPFLDPNRRFGLSVGTHQYIGSLVGCLLFLSLPTFRRSSQAEGEGAPGSSGPVHSGYTARSLAQEGLCRTPSRNPRPLAAAWLGG